MNARINIPIIAECIVGKDGRTMQQALDEGVGGKAKVFKSIIPVADSIAKVEITSDALTVHEDTRAIDELNTSKNTIGEGADGKPDGSVKFKITSDKFNFEDDITIAYQGNSTLIFKKKGFALDFRNKHRFGSWLPFDSLHLKSYHTDWTHARDAVCNWLYEEMFLNRESGNNRPWNKFNDFTAGKFALYSEGGAIAHTDQFPCELYINGVYWGLYSIVMKKDRANYMMDKSNPKHIMLDVDGFVVSNTPAWGGIEIRNPKTLYKTDGVSEYDGDNPSEIIGADNANYNYENAGHVLSNDVKVRINAFNTFLNTLSSSMSKSDIEAHINTEELIDSYLHSIFISDGDKWKKNTLYCTWDGQHWSPIEYDCDQAFIAWNADINYLYSEYDPYNQIKTQITTAIPKINVILSLYDDDIKKRYNYLRHIGVFDAEHIIDLFVKYQMMVGQQAYEKDLKVWNYPNYGSNITAKGDTNARNHSFYQSNKNLKEWLEGRIAFLDNVFEYV